MSATKFLFRSSKMAKQRKSLGRGLGSIISAGVGKNALSPVKSAALPGASAAFDAWTSPNGAFCEIDIAKVVPGTYQARSEFDGEEIKNLADSIASEGLLQPILVRVSPKGTYELLAGERRLRACKSLGMSKITACVQSVSDSSAAARGLIENLQRTNLNPVEEAKGLSNLMANFKLTQDDLSRRIGKPRSNIANTLRILNLPAEIQGYISKGLLSMGHAKAVMGLDDPSKQKIVARRIIEESLNVRGAENLVKRLKRTSARLPRGEDSETPRNAVLRDIERKLSERLNAGVEIRHGSNGGRISIRYANNDDFGRVLGIMGVKI